jgi:hypothetical protein
VPSRNYDTTFGRAAFALAIGAAAGGILTGLIFATLVPFGFTNPEHDPPTLGDLLGAIPVVSVFATLGYGAALVLVGVPMWLLMHRLGWRSWLDAMLGGFLAAGLACFVVRSSITAGTALLFGWRPIIESVLLVAAIGATVGLVVWRIAYRPIAGNALARIYLKIACATASSQRK